MDKGQVTSNFEHVARRYDTDEEIFSLPIAARLVEVAGIGPGDRVLDLGCGTGTALLRAASAVLPGGHVTGIDLSQRMLDIAASRVRDAGLANVTLSAGDAENPPDPPCADGGFDKVIASMVFFLLSDPERASRRWLDLLRPGGLVAFSWNVSEDPAWAPAFAAADSYVPARFPAFVQMIRHWPLTGVAELERMLSGCGFADVRTVTGDVQMRYPSPAMWWDSSWSRAPRLSWQHIPADRVPAARAEVLAMLDGLRDQADGSITRTARFGWTVGVAPGGRTGPARG